MSPQGWVHDVSLGVHPPCRRGSVSTKPKESHIGMPCNPERLRDEQARPSYDRFRYLHATFVIFGAIVSSIVRLTIPARSINLLRESAGVLLTAQSRD